MLLWPTSFLLHCFSQRLCPHYIGRGFHAERRWAQFVKAIGEEKEYPSSSEEMALKYYFVIKLWKNALFLPPSLSPCLNPAGGFCVPRPNRVFSTCKGHRIWTRWGGGVAWVALWLAFSQTQKLVFWWFLRIYLTSALFSCWYFLLLKQWIFWYYSSLQVMAILCCVAKKAASTAQLPFSYTG